MSVYDRLAARAVLQGHTSQHFKATAQEHNRVVWLCLIGGALLWHFGGWKWAAVPLALAAYFLTRRICSLLLARKISPLDSTITLILKKGESELREAEALVNKYGLVLSGLADGTLVEDVSLLPTDKDAMKAALVRCLRHARGTPQQAFLGAAYLSLSTFQEGVGRGSDTELAAASLKEARILVGELADSGFV